MAHGILLGMTGANIGFAEELGIESIIEPNNLGLYAHGVTDPIIGFPETMVIPALKRSLIVSHQGKREFNEELTQSYKVVSFT